MLTFRWLGVAGLEFAQDGYTLLVDPFFTRPPKRAVLGGLRVSPDARLAARLAPAADAVLVTHPHYDHLLDVPEILKRTGARAYGSPNACALLALHGIPGEQRACVTPGDRLELGPFSIEVFPARHTRIPLGRWLNGPLPRRLRRFPARGGARLPLRLSDYRMDACYSFRIQVDGRSLLVGNHPAPAAVLFVAPYHPAGLFAALLATAQPEVVVPIHWDDFTRPLTLPLKPMLLTPAQGLRPRFPPIRRMDLDAFTRQVLACRPSARVLVPEIFKLVTL